ncbi:flavodoxin family protein [uncultured Methanobrevibacter sp.]|uniref:flavodoxin family protein n=1 Tax=uncultured Methanobrevibacter sp. TaxID=253161 RepID=UPI00260A18BB
MKIIALQASPRKGGNCDVLMDEMIKGAEENGHEVVKYYLEKCEIAPCKACMFCAENPDCVREDDGNEIINALVDADGVIFSSPIYYGQMTAQGKLIVDRFYAIGQNPDKSLSGKAALIFTENQAEGTYKQYIELTKFSPFEFMGYDVIGVVDAGSAGPAGIVAEEQKNKLEEAYELGKQF